MQHFHFCRSSSIRCVLLYTTYIAFMTLCQRIIASGHKTRRNTKQKRTAHKATCTNLKMKKTEQKEEAKERKRERNCVLTGESLSACCYCLSVRRQCEQSNAGLGGNVFRIIFFPGRFTWIGRCRVCAFAYDTADSVTTVLCAWHGLYVVCARRLLMIIIITIMRHESVLSANRKRNCFNFNALAPKVAKRKMNKFNTGTGINTVSYIRIRTYWMWIVFHKDIIA